MTTAETLERMAMMVRLADLKALAAKVRLASTDLERQLAASIVVEMASRDWRDSLPKEESNVVCFECGCEKTADGCSLMCAEIHRAEEAADARRPE